MDDPCPPARAGNANTLASTCLGGCLSFQNKLVTIATINPALTTAARNSIATLRSRASFIDCQRSPVDLLPVEGSDRRLSLFATVHLDKAKAFRAAGIPIHDDLGRLHRAVRRKQTLQIGVGHLIGQVSDVQLLSHAGPPSKNHATRQAHSGPVLSQCKNFITGVNSDRRKAMWRGQPLGHLGQRCSSWPKDKVIIARSSFLYNLFI